MKRELVVIGAGPAGMAAAVAAAECGVRVTVLDENRQPGGQIFRSSGDPGIAAGRAMKPLEKLLKQDFRAADIEFWGGSTCVWADENNHLRVVRDGGIEEVEAAALIIATGTHERVFPVEGWTLPGVMTAGAAQALLKGSGVVPSGRVILSGNGPLQLAVAHDLVRLGVEVVAVVENLRPSLRALAQAPRLAMAPDVLLEGIKFMGVLRRARVPYLTGHAVTQISGEGKVESVTVSALDKDFKPVTGQCRKYQVDSVLLSQGFNSSVQLLHLLGCSLEYRASTGGWAAKRDRLMRTSRRSVYAAGDCSGVAGSEVSALEGEIAGRSAAHELGYSLKPASRVRTQQARWKLSRLLQFRKAMDSMSLSPGTATAWMTRSTVVCRCEEVSFGDIEDAVESGATGRDVKLRTRAGMGMCQGRMCDSTVQDIFSGRSLGGGSEFLSDPRFPCSPVRIGAWSGEQHRK